LIAVAAMLAVWLIGWLCVPYLLKLQLQKQGSAQLGREVTMERVVFLPWSLELTVSGVRGRLRTIAVPNSRWIVSI